MKEGSCGESAAGSPLSGLMVHPSRNFYVRSVMAVSYCLFKRTISEGPIVNKTIQMVLKT